ncbi:GntR family transcriptional regulator [Hoeflea poritis]|uniref:GntR family transcriptional regulator n=1 Tax=Hoeflea poritis TaxID=2993659 RepID=A0ABT4VVG9_9HYPH|nr:GntR family transcriptional regulator [Hoeflea poritis]MDA4848721.1 GntR family transcriptional regulator [Hoeflea poritis]
MAQTTLEKIHIPASIDELPKHPNIGFEKFVEAVGNGRLRPGTTLTQAQLCDFLDVSLSPLRESLVLLEEYGLIEVKQRSGITIINPELSFVRENYQFRILIEIEALRAFVANVPEGWLAAVRDRHKSVMATIDKGKRDMEAIEAFVALDQFVHSSFVTALGNKSILSTHNRLQQNIRMVRAMQGTTAYENNLLEAGREHLELFERIEAGDLEGASRCLRRHFESSIYRAVVFP